MQSHQKIQGGTIYLQELTSGHASQDYCNWLNDGEVNKYLETRQATVENLREYITKQLNNPNSFFVGIFDKANDIHIGNIKLEPIDWQKKIAVFGIIIGNHGYLGHGIGTQSTQLILNYAFKTMGLNEVELGVISENKRARRAFEKSGFIYRRTIPKAMDHGGVLYDKIVMSVKKDEFKLENI